MMDISFVTVLLFLGSEGGLPTLIFATLIFAIPSAFVATYIQKWITEASVQVIENDSSIVPYSAKVSVVIMMLVLVSYVSPYPILFGLYYVLMKVIQWTKKVANPSRMPWFAALYTVLTFGILHYASYWLYAVFSVLRIPNQMFALVLERVAQLFTLEQYLVFFIPIIFYEFSKARMSDSSAVMSAKAILSFILLPTVARAVLVVAFAVARGDFFGLERISPHFTESLLLGIAIPAVWILVRERKRLPPPVVSSPVVASTGGSEVSVGARHITSLDVLVVITVVALCAFYANQYLSRQEFLKQITESEMQQEKKMQQYAQKVALEDATPPSPNPVFDAAIVKAKNELAAHLGIPETKITQISYNVKFSGEEWAEYVFCVERNMKSVPFKDVSAAERVETSGNAALVDVNTIRISTTPNQRSSSISVPIMLRDPLPTHFSFDYQFGGSNVWALSMFLDDKKLEYVESSESNRFRYGYAKDKVLPSGITPGLHRLTFSLDGYRKDVSLDISNLYMGIRTNGTYPCVLKGSENRRVIFQEGTMQYTYILNASGKYFRTDGFR